MIIALYKGTRPGLSGVFNVLVRWWCRGLYSHAELIFCDGMSGSSSFLDGGVRVKKIEYSADRWDFFEVPNASEYFSRKWFDDNQNKKFDLRGLFGFVIRAYKEDKKKFFCSESVMTSIGYSEAWRFDPCIIANLFDKIESSDLSKMYPLITITE